MDASSSIYTPAAGPRPAPVKDALGSRHNAKLSPDGHRHEDQGPLDNRSAIVQLVISSLAIAVVFDWPLPWVVLGSALVAIVYTTLGGIKAIIWTDALQAFVFVAAGVAAAVWLFVETPGSCT